ncbi:hypothetical protein [Pyrococcus yayanosii]|uniref:Uncharacterized protein n=1 Tax=Pyrococcus yayanosii (strain CH1 / JCM 16557) TaxID=529709 RepID=F8AFI6_PYRYC|nr:hypothetical protein [Pyrococcus yayanosii]AEH23802.1 hypothetical protein PYCH_00890 [Pyrococcus yayanosii CH1]
MKDVFFWLTLAFVFISAYLSFRGMRKEAILTAGIAGGSALAFALFERFPWPVAFGLGFFATVVFEWARRRS